MLSPSPDKRPTIEEIYELYKRTIDMDIYSLIWHCLEAFSTTSFYQPDMRIALLHSIFKFIESEERQSTFSFPIGPPKTL